MKKDKVRISLDLASNAKDHVDGLLNKSGCSTLVELFRKAIAVFELVIDVQAAKGKIVIENSDGTREVLRVL